MKARKRSWWRTCGLVLLSVVAVVGLVPAGWTLGSLVAGPSADHLEAQGRRLLAVTGPGSSAPRDMQAYFPEGEFFTYVLSGIGLARLADASLYPHISEAARASYLDGARHALEAIDSPVVSSLFGKIDALEHGIFYRGWRLQLVNAIVAAGGDLVAEQVSEARAILAAVSGSGTGWVEGYTGGYWPCDTVAGLAAATDVLPEEAAPVVRRWMSQIVPGQMGLLAHQVGADGLPIDSPRGSSQAIIQTFWPSLLAVATPKDGFGEWSAFTNLFVDRQLGVVAVREWPKGVDAAGDVDSGPLILGLSLSASAVGLAAARANGDLGLATALEREMDWLGVGVTGKGQRMYLAGVLPVAEAFIFWAKTTPLSPATTSPIAVHPLWWLWAPVFALPAVLAIWLWVRRSAGARQVTTVSQIA